MNVTSATPNPPIHSLRKQAAVTGDGKGLEMMNSFILTIKSFHEDSAPEKGVGDLTIHLSVSVPAATRFKRWPKFPCHQLTIISSLRVIFTYD